MTVEQQRTFGETVGLDPVVPTRPHPDDQVECSDGTICLRRDAVFDCRGNAHSNEEDRDETELTIVEELLNGQVEWIDDYVSSDDYGNEYSYLAYERSPAWDDVVEEWLESNCGDFVDDKLVKAVCNELAVRSHHYDIDAHYQSSEYACWGGSGCCVDSFPVGEYEDQVDVSCCDEFVELNAEGRLYGLLESANCECCVRVTERDLEHDYPCFYTYTGGHGCWHFVFSDDTMEQAVTAAIIGLCRAAL